MFTDIEFRSEIGRALDRSNLKPYWAEYFTFVRDAAHLHELAQIELQKEIGAARTTPDRPFLDSQQAVSRVLTSFATRHRFHREFNELFSDLKPHLILGMQLYGLVARQDDWWVYMPTQHAGHASPHASYFKPLGDARYEAFVGRHAA